MRNEVKLALTEGRTVVGTIVNFASPDVVEALGWSGLDFVIIDGEHGPLGIETIASLIRAADVGGIVPVVRVASNSAADILRPLDVGAKGLHIPQVSNSELARLAVTAAKYWPMGSRGLSLSHRAARYGQAETGRYLVQANEETMIVAHIEDQEGVSNIDDIVAVPGVDVVFLGTMDLSQSMGLPGQVNHPRVRSAVTSVIEAAARASVAVGAVAGDAERALALKEIGVRYVVLSTALRLLSTRVREIIERVGW